MKKNLIILIFFSSIKAISQNNSDTIPHSFYIEAEIIFGADNELTNPRDNFGLNYRNFLYTSIGYSFLKQISLEIGFISIQASANNSGSFTTLNITLQYTISSSMNCSINTNLIIPMIKYNFPFAENSFYLKAGTSIALNNNMNFSTSTINNYFIGENISYNLNGLNPVSIGFSAGFGLDLKIFKPLSLSIGSIYIRNHFTPQTIESNIPEAVNFSPVIFTSLGFNAGLIYFIGRK